MELLTPAWGETGYTYCGYTCYGCTYCGSTYYGCTCCGCTCCGYTYCGCTCCGYTHEGKLMPEWEETAAVACAVQNMHLTLTAEGLAGYWSSGGVMGDCAWANAPETLQLLGMSGECQAGYSSSVSQ